MPVASPRSKLKPGSVVRCRTRRYLVEEVQPPVEAGADTVVAMACMEDQAIGQRLTVFLEREIDFEVLGESSWEVVAALPRTRRDELRGRIVMLAERLQSDPRQLEAWRSEHWDGTTLRW